MQAPDQLDQSLWDPVLRHVQLARELGQHLTSGFGDQHTFAQAHAETLECAQRGGHVENHAGHEFGPKNVSVKPGQAQDQLGRATTFVYTGNPSTATGRTTVPPKGLPGHERTSDDRAGRVALGSLVLAAGWRSIMQR